MKLELILSLPPSVNALYQNQARYNPITRSHQLTGQRILSKEGERLKKLMTYEATEAVERGNWDIEIVGDSFLYMDVNIFFNRRGRDADNIFKALQDSMQGIVFKNDSQILPRTQKILFDKANPRVELSFSLVDYVGVFEDQGKAGMFADKCKGCTRYLEGRCSILVDSLAGTVREEIGSINEPECEKFKEKK